MFTTDSTTGASRKIEFEIPNQADMDLAIVAGLLTELGLGKVSVLRLFSQQVYKKNIFQVFLDAVRNDPKLLATHIQFAKTHGYTIVTFQVPNDLLTLIYYFLKQIGEKIGEKLLGYFVESGSGALGGLTGVGKDIAEGMTDQLLGLGKIADGAWDGLTNPVGSEQFHEGFHKMGDGLGRFGKGILKFPGQTVADLVLFDAVKNANALQALLGIEEIGRSLGTYEFQLLRQIFGASVVLEAIRIKSGYAGFLNAGKGGNGWTLSGNHRAITIGNTIYMKNSAEFSTDWYSTLVHETTHVWQFQNGGTDYMLEALWAQEVVGGYKYDREIIVQPPRQPKTWAMLNPEQQGQLIQDAYDAGYFQNGKWTVPKSNPPVVDAFLTNYMNQVKPQLLAGQGAT